MAVIRGVTHLHDALKRIGFEVIITRMRNVAWVPVRVLVLEVCEACGYDKVDSVMEAITERNAAAHAPDFRTVESAVTSIEAIRDFLLFLDDGLCTASEVAPGIWSDHRQLFLAQRLSALLSRYALRADSVESLFNCLCEMQPISHKGLLAEFVMLLDSQDEAVQVQVVDIWSGCLGPACALVSNADNFKNCPYDNSHDALLLGILTSFVLGWQTVERIISMNTEGAACLFQLPSMEEWFPLRDSQIELLPLRECNFVRWKSSLPAYAKGIQSILERGFRSLTVLMHDKEQAIQYWREFSTKYDCWSVHERHYDYYEEQRSILARLYDCLVA